jgi:ABC-type bacteriocin/lantibiotic exporter with double-glycine peptidase domain
MDLQETWKKLEAEKLNKPVLGSLAIQKKSKHPVQRLKTLYLITTGFAVTFLLIFIALFFLFHEPLVKGGLIAVILCYFFFLVVNWSMYKKIKVDLPVDQNLKTVLQHTYTFISDNIRFQERAAIFIYPIAGTSGFLMGGSVGSGNIEKMMSTNFALISLVVTLAILTPTGYFLAKWLNRISYGKGLGKLKELIDELEKPD